MALYVNTHHDRRVWPDLSVDGHTLELDPGEPADLDGDVDDAFLKRATPPTPPAEPPAAPAAPAEPDEEN